jgi:acetylornithine/N-succinyldiaminopimelate aminotransferase
MQALAAQLSARFGGASAFFCNSGAEANEAALKWARKTTGRTGFVALDGSFHGRTFGALSITGQPAKRAAFEPLVPGVTFVPRDDVDALAAAVGDDTAAIVLEPVLGEGGVYPLEAEFVSAARELADESGALLVFDEVQCGVGRTGTFFAFEQLDARPDAVTLAKALANGLPIGALLVSDDSPQGFEPGDHASTFGGNAVACAAACAVCDELDDALLQHVQDASATLTSALEALPAVVEVRGRGLLLGADLDRPAAPVVDACREHGLLVLTAGENILRLTPPLTVTNEELELATGILAKALA